MEKEKIRINEFVQDDLLAQNIYTDAKALYVAENTRLDTYMVKKVRELGVDDVLVYRRKESGGKDPERKKEEAKRFLRQYEEDVEGVRTLIGELAKGEKLNMERVDDLTETLYDEIDSKEHIMQCLSSLKAFDQYTYNHSINVALYGMLIAKWLGMGEEGVKDIVRAGLLHDIGKSQIPDEILNKRSPLSREEFELMKRHPALGFFLARNSGIEQSVHLDGILMHHERFDGTGYPLGIRGRQISLSAKIIAVADVYDALTSERVYKKRITPFETFRIIEDTGLGHFDTQIMQVFLSNVAYYYTGMKVRMNTGEQGIIACILPHCISRPIVELSGRLVDLSRDKRLDIIEIIG